MRVLRVPSGLRVLIVGLMSIFLLAPAVGAGAGSGAGTQAAPGSGARAGGGGEAGRIIDRFYEAYRAGSVERMLVLYAPDAVFEDVNQRHRFAGTEQLRAMLTGIIGLHDVIDLREQRRVMDGDTIVVEYEYAGRLSGEALSQATGKEGCPDLDYSLPVTSWYRVENGRIVHQKDFIDLATFMELQRKAAAAKADPTESGAGAAAAGQAPGR